MRSKYANIVLPKYKKLAKIANNMASVGCMKLKTDCWNEAGNNSIASMLENCVCIDINRKIMNRMKKHHPEVCAINGDITNMPFGDEIFGLVIDLSTIDHVEDYRKVFDEYYRVLEKNGILLLVSWLYRRKGSRQNKRASQYAFNFKEFKDELVTRFNVLDEGTIYGDAKKSKTVLYWFICEK